MAFDFGGIAGGHIKKGDFDMAKFFGVRAPRRISTLATPAMIRDRLVELFGEQEEFTDDMAVKMKAVISADLEKKDKFEYMSHYGLALLFDKAGGHLTSDMNKKIHSVKMKDIVHQKLLMEVQEVWDDWDLKETDADKNDGRLGFHAFYNGFMAPYFGCYECESSRKGLQAIDMNKNGLVDWEEFCVYLKWALHEYPDINTKEELLETAFQKGLIPAMQDEILKST